MSYSDEWEPLEMATNQCIEVVSATQLCHLENNCFWGSVTAEEHNYSKRTVLKQSFGKEKTLLSNLTIDLELDRTVATPTEPTESKQSEPIFERVAEDTIGDKKETKGTANPVIIYIPVNEEVSSGSTVSRLVTAHNELVLYTEERSISGLESNSEERLTNETNNSEVEEINETPPNLIPPDKSLPMSQSEATQTKDKRTNSQLSLDSITTDSLWTNSQETNFLDMVTTYLNDHPAFTAYSSPGMDADPHFFDDHT